MKEYMDKIGRSGHMLDSAGVKWRVHIHDVRQAYGRVDYLVSPSDGHGVRWVSSDSVEMQE